MDTSKDVKPGEQYTAGISTAEEQVGAEVSKRIVGNNTLPPKLVAGIGIPSPSAFKAVSKVVAGSILTITFTWFHPEILSNVIQGYRIYAQNTLAPQATPVLLGEVPASPAVLTFALPASYKFVFYLQTILTSGRVPLDSCPTAT